MTQLLLIGGEHGDLSEADLRLIIQTISDHNDRLELLEHRRDEQLQKIETTLDTVLMAMETENA